DITFTDALSLTTAGATLTVNAFNAINVDNTITTSNADVTLTSGTGDITFLATGDVSSTGGDVTISSTGGGAIVMVAGTVIDAGSGLIDINSTTAGLTLGQLDTTSAATTDGAEAIRLSAGGGIGFSFLSNITANGNIVVQGAAVGTTLTVGGAGLGNFLAGGTLIIGRDDGTSTLTVTASTLNSATEFRNDADIDIQGTITNFNAGDATTLDAGSGDILFTGGGGTRITSNAGDITLSSTLELDGSAYTLTSNNGDISLSAITDGSGGGSDLTADAGTGAYSHSSANLNAGAGILTATGATVGIGSSLIADTATLNGTATGSGLNVGSLTITGSGATLFGTVNGKSGDFAAAQATMPDADTHTINGCTVSTCPVEEVTEPEAELLDVVYATTSSTDSGSTSTGDSLLSVDSDPVATDTATTDVSSDSGTDSGGTVESGDWATGSFDPLASDPVMSTSFTLSLADFALRLEEAELDDAELLMSTENAEDPALAALTQDLLLLLGEYELVLADSVPTDAFNGIAAVVIPDLVSFEPKGAEENEDTFLAYLPSGFALYQY
ncbi:MAG: hypothetical protein V3T80_10010, partial [Kiloniellales bacterium]